MAIDSAMSGMTLKIEGVERLLEKVKPPSFIHKEISLGLYQSGLAVQREAQLKVPVDTSRLRDSIVTKLDNAKPLPRWAQVGTNVFYGPYVEFGTGIYGPKKRPIRPTTKKALAWKSKSGETIIRSSVKGMRPRPYMIPALKLARGRIGQIWQETMGRIEQQWGRP